MGLRRRQRLLRLLPISVRSRIFTTRTTAMVLLFVFFLIASIRGTAVSIITFIITTTTLWLLLTHHSTVLLLFLLLFDFVLSGSCGVVMFHGRGGRFPMQIGPKSVRVRVPLAQMGPVLRRGVLSLVLMLVPPLFVRRIVLRLFRHELFHVRQ